jgi:molybdopterin synthase sulfur carrier subunit
MITVQFTSNIQRHVSCPTQTVSGKTLKEVLNRVFENLPEAKGYVLDDHNAVRKHIVIFINGERIQDRVHLSDPTPDNAEVYIFQALSGG